MVHAGVRGRVRLRGRCCCCRPSLLLLLLMKADSSGRLRRRVRVASERNDGGF